MNWNGCTFGSRTDFSRARFHAEANFQNCQFKHEARFQDCSFEGPLSFSNASFEGKADFSRVSFKREANFRESKFRKNADFSICEFREAVWFSRSVFNSDVKFSGTIFHLGAFFGDASIDKEAQFSGVEFGALAWFEGVEFGSHAIFNHVTCKDNVIFSKCAFGGAVDFSRSFFSSKAAFDGSDTKINSPTNVSDYQSFRGGNFSASVFLSDVILTDRNQLAPMNFEDCFFGGVVEFQGSRLHQGTSFVGASFNFVLKSADGLNFSRLYPDRISELFVRGDLQSSDGLTRSLASRLLREFRENLQNLNGVSDIGEMNNFENEPLPDPNRRYASIEGAFRKLKLSMEEIRHRIEEQRFYRYELLARRRRSDLDVPRWEWLVSHFYEWISDFGGSILRPMAGLFLCLVPIGWILAYLFSLASPEHNFEVQWGGEPDPEIWNSLAFSLSNVFPFGVFGEIRSEIFERFDSMPGLRLVFGALATIQSIFALILVFLTGLAIRRRFQIS